MRFTILLAAALASTSPALATVAAASQPAAAADAAWPQRLQIATQLVDLIHRDEELLQANLLGWESAVRTVLQKDPTVVKLEADFPGLMDAGVAAGRPLAIEYLRPFVVKSKAAKAEIFARRMSIDELQQAKQFIGGAVGQRFIQRAKASIDIGKLNSELTERSLQTGSKFATIEDSDRLVRDAARQATKDTSGQDLLAIMKFERTPVAKKLREATREAEKAVLEMANNPPAEWVARQNEAVSAAMIAFAERKGGLPTQ
jgi:hypothetical protein